MKVAFSRHHSWVTYLKRFQPGQLVNLIVTAVMFSRVKRSTLPKFSLELFMNFEFDWVSLIRSTATEESLHKLAVSDIPVELEQRVLMLHFGLLKFEVLVFHLVFM